MNLLSSSSALSTFSNWVARIGLYLPFAALDKAFVSLDLYSRVFHGLFFRRNSRSFFPVLQTQRAFLIAEGLAQGLSVDFLIFEAFIGVATIVGLASIALSGLLSAQVLASSRGKVEIYEKQSLSPARFLIFLIGLPVAIFFSLNFRFALHSPQAHAPDGISSPRSFLCLSAFVFCASVYFLVEQLLILVWAVFLAE